MVQQRLQLGHGCVVDKPAAKQHEPNGKSMGPGSRVVRGASMAPTPEREYGTAMGDGERGE